MVLEGCPGLGVLGGLGLGSSSLTGRTLGLGPHTIIAAKLACSPRAPASLHPALVNR